MTDFKLGFGKFKGQNFLSTPLYYQSWLLRQDWFKVPTKASPSKEISQLSGKLAGWDGYSRKGAAIYDGIFEAEKAEEDAYFDDPSPWSSRYDGSY
jgi:hypothetical protein